jgi:hypothetical protein
MAVEDGRRVVVLLAVEALVANLLERHADCQERFESSGNRALGTGKLALFLKGSVNEIVMFCLRQEPR